VKAGFESKPVNFVSIVDAAYFANWMNNGQPVQSLNDPPLYAIRTGAYDIYPDPTAFTRSPEAAIFLPNENEWYKAAYYDASLPDYFLLPTNSNSAPNCTGPTGASNSANCYHGAAALGLTPVGSYPGSPSPYDTFDQGGNAAEWTETKYDDLQRVVRGGSFYEGYANMVSATRDSRLGPHRGSLDRFPSRGTDPRAGVRPSGDAGPDRPRAPAPMGC
jgi:hypothetical protein